MRSFVLVDLGRIGVFSDITQQEADKLTHRFPDCVQNGTKVLMSTGQYCSAKSLLLGWRIQENVTEHLRAEGLIP